MHAHWIDLKWISLAFKFHVNIFKKLDEMVQFIKLIFSADYVPNSIEIMAIFKLKQQITELAKK